MNKIEKRLFDIAKHTIQHPIIIGIVICKDSSDLYFTIKGYNFILQKQEDHGCFMICLATENIHELAKLDFWSIDSFCKAIEFKASAAEEYNVFLELHEKVYSKQPFGSKVVEHKTKFDLIADDILGST